MKQTLTLALCCTTILVAGSAHADEENYGPDSHYFSPDGKHKVVITRRTRAAEVKFFGESELKATQPSVEVSNFQAAVHWAPDSRTFALASEPTKETPRFRIYTFDGTRFIEKNLPSVDAIASKEIKTPHRLVNCGEKFGKWLTNGTFVTKQTTTVQLRSEDGSQLIQKLNHLTTQIVYSSPSTADFRVLRTHLQNSRFAKF